MNRKIYLIIIWSITLFVICFSGLRLSKNVNTFWHSGIFNFDSNEEEDEWSSSNSETENFHSETLDSFTSIEADTSVLAITIKSGADYKIEWNVSNKKLIPVCSVENGVLKIKQQNFKKNNSGKNNHSELSITVPRGVQLSSVDINTNVGQIDISGFDAAECKIQTNVGAVSLENFDFDTLDINTDVGAVSVVLLEEISEMNMDLKTDIGAISIEGKSFKNKFTQNGTGTKQLSIQTDVGAISIK